jgi:hypothetical protein
MIDVFPLAPGVWAARCECGATEQFPNPEQGWTWVLSHPCPSLDEEDDEVGAPQTIDLTDSQRCQH